MKELKALEKQWDKHSEEAAYHFIDVGLAACHLLEITDRSHAVEYSDVRTTIMELMEAGRFDDAVESGKHWQIQSAYRAQLKTMADRGREVEEERNRSNE